MLRQVIRSTRQSLIRNNNTLRYSGLLSQVRLCSGVGSGHLTNETVATVGTMNDVKSGMVKKLGIQEHWAVLPPSREYLSQHEPKTMDELPARSMQDSFISVLIPLSTDLSIRAKYETFLGSVRLGRLMEDMDLFAVWVVHHHVKILNLDPTVPLPYMFATLLADRISFTDHIPKNDQDIHLLGHVSWVGKTSIEVVVWVEQKIQGKWCELTRAFFLIASRNATNTAAAIINPLHPATEEEKRIYAGGEIRKKQRIQLQKESLFNHEPNAFEQNLIHNIFMSTMDLNSKSFNVRSIPSNGVWMEEAQLQNAIYSHPEDRNPNHVVFGGFLIRQALELSWACAYQFCKYRPKLEHISDIQFHRPVPVSSLLKMHAHVIFTEKNYMEIVVVNEIFDAMSGDYTMTNVFYYTYSTLEQVPRVIPKTYNEAMWYLDGRRKFNAAMGLDGQRENTKFDTLSSNR